MWQWFSRSEPSPGLEQIRLEFGEMIDAGRHVFDTAANALLGGTDLEVIRQDVFDTDVRINKAERRIRKELVVHATVHGAVEFPTCLVMMSIVKDAERIGDYAKNLFDLAALSPAPLTGPLRDELVEIKDRISRALSECHKVFDSQNADDAKALIKRCKEVEDRCDVQVEDLIKSPESAPQAVAFALAYRYFKRVASHTLNITTSVTQPIHKLDFVKDKKKDKSKQKADDQDKAESS